MIVGLCLLIIALIIVGFSVSKEGFTQAISDDGPLYTKVHEQLLQVEALWRAKQQQNLQVLTPMCTTEDEIKSKLRDTLTAGYAADRGATTTTTADIEKANKEIQTQQNSWGKQLFDCFRWRKEHIANVLNEGYADTCQADDLVVTQARAAQWNTLFKNVGELEKAVERRPILGPILATEAWMQSVIQPSIDRMKDNQNLEGFAASENVGIVCVHRADIVAAVNTLTKLQTILADPEDGKIVQTWMSQHKITRNMMDTLNNYAKTTTSTHTVD